MKENNMRILVADDHELFLKGLEFILQDLVPQPEILVAKNYTEIFAIIEQDQNFNLLLTDLAMPGAYWLEALKKIHHQLPETPVIILSAVFEDEIVRQTLELGAAGYLSKTTPNSEILKAINLVLSGGAYIPQELLDQERNHNPELMIAESQTSGNTKLLSPRQQEVIDLIAKGLSNKQIAFELGITEGTVKLYVTAILKLLNVYNRTGAVMKARKMGILNDEQGS